MGTRYISGEIKNMVPGDQLSILIQSPNGNLVALDQLTVSSDNQFSTEIKLGGNILRLIDLAGSENINKAKTSGINKAEGININ